MFILSIVYIHNNIVLTLSSSQHDKDVDQLQEKLPKGIWLSFDFEDSHPVGIPINLIGFLMIHLSVYFPIMILCFL